MADTVKRKILKSSQPRAVKAQQRWAEISGVDRVHYCGAYWFYGFHEDGVRSAVRMAEALGVQW